MNERGKMSKVQKLKNIIFAFLVIASLATIAYFSFSSFFSADDNIYGDGSKDSPFKITAVGDKDNPTEGTFYYYVKNGQFESENKYYFIQTANLELKAFNQSDLCNFKGTYNGNNNVICVQAGTVFNEVSGKIENLNFKNAFMKCALKVNADGVAYAESSLAITLRNATINNIKIIEHTEEYGDYIEEPADYNTIDSLNKKEYYGGLAIYSYDSVISNVTYSPVIRSGIDSEEAQEVAWAGGIVTFAYNTTFSSCVTNNRSVYWSNVNTVGGIVAEAKNCRVENSVILGSFDGQDCMGTLRGYIAGGLIGVGTDCTIVASYNRTEISGKTAGGLFGKSTNCLIDSCYNSGKIISSENGGGLIGENLGGTNLLIRDSYNIGTVAKTAGISGSLIGSSSELTSDAIHQSYNILSGFTTDDILPLIGSYNGGSESNAYGENLTNNEMQDNSSYMGWLYGASNWRWYNSPAQMKIDNLDYSIKMPRLYWEEINYLTPHMVNFHPGYGALGSMKPQTVFENLPVKLKNNEFERVDYKFDGWALSIDGDVVYENGAMITSDKDVDLYAIWTLIDTYILTLDAGEGKTFEDGSRFYEYTVYTSYPIGEEMPSPVAPSGFRFIGYKLDMGDGVQFINKYTIYKLKKKATATASYLPIHYHITYDLNGGTGSITQDGTSEYTDRINGIEVTSTDQKRYSYGYVYQYRLESDFEGITKDGFVLAGLSLEKDGELINFGSDFQNLTTTNHENITVYLQWRNSKFKLTLDANGGWFIDFAETILNFSITYGKEIDNLPVAERTGYIFEGYFDEETGMEVKAGDKVLEFRDIYAKARWKAISYTVEYYDSVSAITPLSSQTCIYEQTYTYPAFQKVGYTLSGFVLEENGDIVGVPNETFSNLSTTNGEVLKRYCKWEAEIYDIVIWQNSSETDTNKINITCSYGQSLNLNSNTLFNREHYTLMAIGTERDGTGTNFEKDGLGTIVIKVSDLDVSNIMDKTINLYAIWQGNTYSVTLDANGGTFSGSSNTQKTVNCTWGAPMPSVGSTLPIREGYTFGGFYYNGTQYYDDELNSTHDFDIDSANIIMYAEWTPKTYNIILSYGYDEITETVQVEYGSKISGNHKITRTNYEFYGFYTELDGGGDQYIDANGNGSKEWTYDGELILHAYWLGEYKTITFYKNDGSGVTQELSVRFGSTIDTSEVNFEREGYDLLGWSASSSATSATFTVNSRIWLSDSIPLDLYAVWKHNQITITYHSNYGTDKTEIRTVNPGSVTLIGCPWSRTGYTFTGWSRLSSGEIVTSPTTCNSDTHFYAIWGLIQYPVVAEADNGSPKSGCTLSVSPNDCVITGTKVTFTATITDTNNYEFVGWYKYDSLGTSELVSSSASYTTTLTETTTFYAYWKEREKVTISFNSYGGTSVSSITINKGSAYPSRVNTSSKTGYSFDGWYKGTARLYNSSGVFLGSSSATVTSNITLTASWTEETFNVFAGRHSSSPTSGCSYSVSPSTVTASGTSVTFTASVDTGYTFHGWFSSSSGTNAVSTSSSYTTKLYSSTTYYAYWTKNTYSVTFSPNGGSFPSGTTTTRTGIAHGQTIENFPTPTRTGYTFLGYATSSNATSGVSEYQVTRTVTLYAVWSLKSYTITFYANGGKFSDGTSTKTVTYKHGESISYPSATRTGYTVKGINTYSSATSGLGSQSATGNKSYYIIWEGNTYTIIFSSSTGSLSFHSTTGKVGSGSFNKPIVYVDSTKKSAYGGKWYYGSNVIDSASDLERYLGDNNSITLTFKTNGQIILL